MNLSLRYRVTLSFIISTMVVLILSFIVYYFLEGLSKEIDGITDQSSKISILTDQVRITAVSIIKDQRKILTKKATPKDIEITINHCEEFISQLDQLDSLYKDSEVEKFVAKMKTHIDYLQLALSKNAQFQSRGGENVLGLANIEVLADKILETFSEFQDIQYFQSIKRSKKFEKIINETKKNMMIVLIIGFLATIILSLVYPGKIALPFKKIKDAIRELQDCNFDVSIYYYQDDEIGDIAREMNKMIRSFKIFDELRTNRILVENRKFDALANLVKKPVLLANAEGKLIYMNNKLYSLLQVQSEEVIGKAMVDSVMPSSIISCYKLAIKRRSKIENMEVVIPAKKLDKEPFDESHKLKTVDVKGKEKGKYSLQSGNNEEVEAKEAIIFRGYANVIPIRGKESSLDYYLMVLSEEVFT